MAVGSGDCVWDDWARLLGLLRQAGQAVTAFAVVNDMIPIWPDRIDYACSLHPEKLRGWLDARRRAGLQRREPQTWGHRVEGPRGRLPRRTDRTTTDWAGSSGLFATKVLLEEGMDRVVLVGVPMRKQNAHLNNRAQWGAAEQFHRGWKGHYAEIRDRVRSMSGWTRELLGEPSERWLRG